MVSVFSTKLLFVLNIVLIFSLVMYPMIFSLAVFNVIVLLVDVNFIGLILLFVSIIIGI